MNKTFDKEITSILTELQTELNETTSFSKVNAKLRQPVQTLYGGGHLFREDSFAKISRIACETFANYVSGPQDLVRIFAINDHDHLAEKIYERVHTKLTSSALEDYRIDFEDGYGYRPDEEEDHDALSAADTLAEVYAKPGVKPYVGIRIKPLSSELAPRAIRTLQLFLSRLLERTHGVLPKGFVITLPKVYKPAQVMAIDKILTYFESKAKLSRGSIAIEIMVESSRSLMNQKGISPLPELLQAAAGRCRGVHFGTYDFTASVGITAAKQSMGHPMSMFALQMMKIAFSEREVWLSDGATTHLPIAKYRDVSLSEGQRRANQIIIEQAWRESFANITRSLELGLYQGWDLHPAQLPVRYIAMFNFFLQSLDEATQRLKHFIRESARATRVGSAFDDAATGQGLLNYFSLAVECGAIDEDVLEKVGLSLAEVKAKSFVEIVKRLG